MTSPLMTPDLIATGLQLIAEANRVGGQFCNADIDMAMSMLDRAAITSDSEARQRNVRNAREACEVISHIFGRLTLTADESRRIAARLEELRARIDDASG